MRDNEELMNELRGELRRAVQQRFKRIDLDRFKQEIREHVTHFLYDKTQRSPIIIPVVNVIGKGGPATPNGTNGEAFPKPEVDPQVEAVSQARRFAQLRQQLLNQDARTD